MSENEFDEEQFKEEKREWVLKVLDGLYRVDKDTVIEWINTVWPACLGVTEDKAHPEKRKDVL